MKQPNTHKLHYQLAEQCYYIYYAQTLHVSAIFGHLQGVKIWFTCTENVAACHAKLADQLKYSFYIICVCVYIIFTFSEPCIVLYKCENDQIDAHFFSLIYFNYTFLYMFRTNKLIIWRLRLYMHENTICCMYRRKHTHTHTYIYIYRERERERESTIYL